MIEGSADLRRDGKAIGYLKKIQAINELEFFIEKFTYYDIINTKMKKKTNVFF